MKTLFDALHTLARLHTRFDHEMGFTVVHGVHPELDCGCSMDEYLEAWKAVREQLHMPAKPGDQE